MSGCRPVDNPFNTAAVARLRYRLSAQQRQDLWGELQRLGGQAALVGPEGTGKTTLLEDLAADHRRRGGTVRWLQCHRDALPADGDLADFLAGLRADCCCCIDGAESLGRLRLARLRRACRRAGGLLLTLHRPRLGLPVLRRHATDEELLGLCLRELVGGAARDWEVEARRAFAACRGNLREVWRRLYDLAAAGVAPPSSGASPRPSRSRQASCR